MATHGVLPCNAVAFSGLASNLTVTSSRVRTQAKAVLRTPFAGVHGPSATPQHVASCNPLRSLLRPSPSLTRGSRVVSASAKGTVASSQALGFVAGDIGGTNARLQFWKTTAEGMEKGAPSELVFEKIYPTSQYKTVVDVFRAFLDESKRALGSASAGALPPKNCCIAVAGVCENGICNMTNLGWVVSEAELEDTFGIAQVTIINDFEAVGYGVAAVGPEDKVIINDVPVVEGCPAICVGPGTGLGEALMTWDDDRGRYKVWPSEGGHVDFGPRGDLQRELQAYVEHEMGNCELEYLACGSGLQRIYRFFRDRAGKGGPDLAAPDISKGAAAGDPICNDAVNMFLAILAAEAGNLGLKCLAQGGIYLAGGILPRFVDRIKSKEFKEAFLHPKSRFTKVIETFPLFLVLNTSVGLLGAKELAYYDMRTGMTPRSSPIEAKFRTKEYQK
eukprot:jgi/Mesvir1/13002/Mv06006-RA.1